MHTAHVLRSQLRPRFQGIGVRLGDRVMVQGLFSGTVKYIGDLDRSYPSSGVYVGVKLDDPGW